MYLKHFGFEKKPFNITPNPDFMFLSATHKEVFAHLLYGIQNHCGFIEVTGEVGTGKTTVLRTLFKQLDDELYRLALIFNPRLDAVELLQSINREFGIAADTGSLSELQSLLNDFLLQQNRDGHTVVLVVDEAQNLSPDVLEQIRLLSNLETETDKLIQIILVGQPELQQMLRRDDLRQLRQRITVSYHLETMTEEDSLRYIQHRMSVAGQSRSDLFTPAALKLILKRSGGNPRLINILCDRCLLVCFSENGSQVTDKHVRQARKELWREKGHDSGGRRYLYATLLLAAVILAAGFWFYDQEKNLSGASLSVEQPLPAAESPHRSVPSSSVLESPVSGTTDNPGLEKRLFRLRRSLDRSPDAARIGVACNALLAIWHLPPLKDGERLAVNDIAHAASTRGLDVASYTGGLEGLLRFNLPVILDLTVPGARGRRYLALTGVDSGGYRYAPVMAGIDLLRTEELKALWSGRAILLWRNHDGLSPVGQPGQRGTDIERIQQLLAKAGYYRGNPTGVFDQPTVSAVTRFQADSGLLQDGRIGPQTLILLYRAAGFFEAELGASTSREEGA
ncbi:ExeA family protein [Geothermobacter hydrogeniphilus]|uniref:AAA+ ATPase domain-containing protein n=1 Tax=Geothermobacter hydrogeniphilus TaxID=1969733 RepID=A0A1X0YEL1_9BACT|nr:ExeA family protein [Geothermobacter hydrogeniphilus]ORJ63598.1 hypothetical protein B5V00_01660 [Geothermobacter hydrogeniphilus]